MDAEQLKNRVGVPMETLEAFCQRWNVRELALFGSVLRDDFGPDSDIDLLVSFKSRPTPGIFGITEMERELTNLMGRKVDLISRSAFEYSPNYIRRREILSSAHVVYAA